MKVLYTRWWNDRVSSSSPNNESAPIFYSLFVRKTIIWANCMIKYIKRKITPRKEIRESTEQGKNNNLKPRPSTFSISRNLLIPLRFLLFFVSTLSQPSFLFIPYQFVWKWVTIWNILETLSQHFVSQKKKENFRLPTWITQSKLFSFLLVEQRSFWNMHYMQRHFDHDSVEAQGHRTYVSIKKRQ